MDDLEIIKQIGNFHKNRIDEIKQNKTLMPIIEGGRIVFHLIPHDAFKLETYYDLSVFDNDVMVLKPLKDAGHDITYFHEGLMSFSVPKDKCIGYALLFGNGIVEAVDGYYTSFNEQGKKVIPVTSFEEALKIRAEEYLALQKKMEAKLPIYMFLNFLNVEGCLIGAPAGLYMGNVHPIYSKDLNFQRLSIGKYEDPIEKILKTWLDRLWNAGGYPRSAHYDNKGNWIKR